VHRHPPLTRRIVPVAGIAAAVVAAGALISANVGNGANAALTTKTVASSTTTGPHTWAYNAAGKKVTVYKPTASTPVHPEKLTHPRTDDMGLITAAHMKKASTATPAITPEVTQLPGIDISAFQGNLTWSSIAPHIDFVYAKATEGTYYTNPDFTNQYNGPYDAGVIRGSYHFAIPNNSTGTAQADYFIAHGGGWSSDGKTLPGALDIEYNPYGAECYGLSQSAMTTWVKDFVNEYAFKEHVYPVIYTTFDWWNTCTGNASGFSSNDPLWIADYNGSAGTLLNGYGFYTFWQYADSGSEPGDQDVFNGALSQLQAIAKG
jgi:GH25 family lysozyme M1 (1,4-beta-N-acetylmuramidase)